MWDKLVREAKEGNKNAMEEIIGKLKPLVISSIKRYYNKPGGYEELIQEGNLTILESLVKYDSRKQVHFLGFIQSKLKYLYLNKHKERIHLSLNQPTGDGDTEIMDIIPSEDISPLDMILEEEKYINLKKSLDKLTERQREIILLFYATRLSIEDIAKQLNISYRTVVNTKTRALEIMRQ